jgi:hypothetical protein
MFAPGLRTGKESEALSEAAPADLGKTRAMAQPPAEHAGSRQRQVHKRI